MPDALSLRDSDGTYYVGDSAIVKGDYTVTLRGMHVLPRVLQFLLLVEQTYQTLHTHAPLKLNVWQPHL